MDMEKRDLLLNVKMKYTFTGNFSVTAFYHAPVYLDHRGMQKGDAPKFKQEK